METNIYLQFWKNKASHIKVFITYGYKEYPIEPHELESIGNRPKTGFQAKALMKDGSLLSEPKNNAVDRGLHMMIREDSALREKTKGREVLIQLRDFTLVVSAKPINYSLNEGDADLSGL